MKLKLHIIHGLHQGARSTLGTQDSLVITRRPDPVLSACGGGSPSRCLVLKRDQKVSYPHARVVGSPHGFILCDLKSRNGTWVGSRCLAPGEKHLLADGDLIRCGEQTLQATLDQGWALSAMLRPPPPARTETVPDTDCITQAGRPPVYPNLKLLAPGSGSKVYLSRDPRTGEEVAKKVMPLAARRRRNELDRILRDPIILQSLHHEHIVRSLDLGVEGDTIFHIMEYVDGKTLAELIHHTRGGLPPSSIARIGIQVLSALEYAHDQRFLHRDIKPPNILCKRAATGWIVKLTDFGLGRALVRDLEDAVTQIGEVYGTPEYIAPEQFFDFPNAGRAADIFSVGATLYEALAGRTVYTFPSGTSMAEVIRTTPLPPPAPPIDPDLWRIIARSLARRPEDRYPTARAMGEALTHWRERFRR